MTVSNVRAHQKKVIIKSNENTYQWLTGNHYTLKSVRRCALVHRLLQTLMVMTDRANCIGLIHIYIYIYIYRERERERDIYIYR